MSPHEAIEAGTVDWRLLVEAGRGGVFDASMGAPFTATIGGDALGLKSTAPAIDVPNLRTGNGCGSLSNPAEPPGYIRTQYLAFSQPATLRGTLGRNTIIGQGC